MELNHSNVLPGVFLTVLELLAADKNSISWQLSRSQAGKFSLRISHLPAKNGSTKQHRTMTGSGTRKKDSVTASVPETPLAPKPKTKRKQMSPAQRNRERLIKWRRKRTRKADTGSVPLSANPTTSQANGIGSCCY